MTPYLSNKLKVLGFISIVAIIYWHAYMMPEPAKDFAGFYLFQNMISSAGLRFSIPLFFAISGYLFFFKPFNYLRQLKKRTRSLLIPYLVWSLLGAIFVYSVMSVPALATIINLNWEYSWTGFLKHATISPIQFQFWFLQDLMVLTVLSPLIYWLNKKISLPLIIALILWWLWVGDKAYIIRVESLLFFSIGASLAIHNHSLFNKKPGNALVLISGCSWILLSGFYGYCLTHRCFPPVNPMIFYGLTKIAGLIFVWTVYDINRVNRFLNTSLPAKLLSSTFFIFCFHEPVLSIIEKIELSLFNHPGGLVYLFYFINPIIVLFLAYSIYKTLQTQLPKSLIFLTGGR